MQESLVNKFMTRTIAYKTCHVQGKKNILTSYNSLNNLETAKVSRIIIVNLTRPTNTTGSSVSSWLWMTPETTKLRRWIMIMVDFQKRSHPQQIKNGQIPPERITHNLAKFHIGHFIIIEENDSCGFEPLGYGIQWWLGDKMEDVPGPARFKGLAPFSPVVPHFNSFPLGLL